MWFLMGDWYVWNLIEMVVYLVIFIKFERKVLSMEFWKSFYYCFCIIRYVYIYLYILEGGKNIFN